MIDEKQADHIAYLKLMIPSTVLPSTQDLRRLIKHNENAHLLIRDQLLKFFALGVAMEQEWQREAREANTGTPVGDSIPCSPG